MKRILTMLVFSSLLLVSCGSEPNTTESSGSSVETSVTESSESAPESSTSETSEVSEESETTSATSEVESSAETENGTVQTASVYTANVDLTAIGGDTIQWDYNTRYTNIDGELIRYVGNDLFQDWVGDGYNPNVNLQTFIQEFGLTKEEFLQITEQIPDSASLPAEEIDILFSGDQAAINRTFASEYAAVSKSGDIYTIFWLGEHTAEDYKSAGLSADAVASTIENCKTLEIEVVDEYCAKAQAALDEITS